MGEYREGDLLDFQYIDDEGFISLDQQMRVYEIDISYDALGVEQATIKIAETKPITTRTHKVDELVSIIVESEQRLTELEK